MHETHCKQCGAIDAHEHRERCDGCGKLIKTDAPSSYVQMHIEQSHRRLSENARAYCPECTAIVQASLPAWRCARCDHPRHMHNRGCLMLLEPLPNGGYQSCDCSHFVAPDR
jgi:hypothetical protein